MLIVCVEVSHFRNLFCQTKFDNLAKLLQFNLCQQHHVVPNCEYLHFKHLTRHLVISNLPYCSRNIWLQIGTVGH